MATYEAFLRNINKYHIYEIIASKKICVLNKHNSIKIQQ